MLRRLVFVLQACLRPKVRPGHPQIVPSLQGVGARARHAVLSGAGGARWRGCGGRDRGRAGGGRRGGGRRRGERPLRGGARGLEASRGEEPEDGARDVGREAGGAPHVFVQRN